MSSITFEVNQPYGSPTAVTTPVGGGWPNTTISCRVVAWQTAAETDVDMAGFNHGTVALFNGILPSANDQIEITFTPPTVPFDHLSFYYQIRNTWDNTVSCAKCTMTTVETSETSWTLTIPNDDDTATITFGNANSAVISPVQLISPTISEKVVRGWNGLLVTKSRAVDLLTDALEITAPMGATTATEYDKILKWIKYGIPVKLTDTAWQSVQPYITTYTGKLVSTTYLKSPNKNSEPEFSLTFMVEGET